MMQRRISAAETAPIRVVLVTLDSHLAEAAERARPALVEAIPGLILDLHAAAEWANDPAALERCRNDISKGDIIIATMLFMEDHIQAVLPWLKARRETCDAMIGCLSAGDVIKLTKLGGFAMDGSPGGAMALLKRLRGANSKREASSGAGQMAMLRRLPKILRFIPGTAQDVRAYFLTLQYWLAGSEDNVANMVRFLIDRYASGDRRMLKGALKSLPPVEYPDVGVYHPARANRIATSRKDLPRAHVKPLGTVGLLLMRSYILANNTAHYDGVIAALEAKGLNVVPAFACGLDARPAIDAYFVEDGQVTVDAVVSLTGFSLVGGPAYNDAKAAETVLASLDVPYLAAHALEFQTLEQWSSSDRGLMPVEATMMVAIPELDGAAGPLVFGGRSDRVGSNRTMQSHPERANRLASRVQKLVRLRKTERQNRKVAIVIFNFPPNAGATGTAAFLSVFQSLQNTLLGLKRAGYTVDVPTNADALRQSIIAGNAARHGANANVYAKISTEHHVRTQPWLDEIEAQWGPAPGRHNSDGSSLFILGQAFGNVLVGVQPAFGYEGDPDAAAVREGLCADARVCRVLPVSVRDDFGADAVLHFGTHGALEFMPGKQAGLSAACWPDRLIGDLPNFYLYAANNPSEGTIGQAPRGRDPDQLSDAADRTGRALSRLDRSQGIARALAQLSATDDADCERSDLADLIQAQAAALDLASAEPQWPATTAEAEVLQLVQQILELEYALIPHGLHVVGEATSAQERAELLARRGRSDPWSRAQPAPKRHSPRAPTADAAQREAATQTRPSASAGLLRLSPQ